MNEGKITDDLEAKELKASLESSVISIEKEIERKKNGAI